VVPAAPKLHTSSSDIDALVDDIARARNPVIVAEIAGKDPAVFLALVDFADQFAIPIISGRAMMYANFPTDNPLYLGVATYQHLEDADLVLLVGGRAPWYPPRSRPTSGRIVMIQENPIKDQMFYQNLHADRYLEGDAATTLRMLAEGLDAAASQEEVRASRRERWRREHHNLVNAQNARMAKAAVADAIDAFAIAHALREAMPKDAIYIDETITHSVVLRQYLKWTVPQSYFRPYGGLGQGIGYGLGMKLAKPERTVVLLVGDGSFLYSPVIPAFGAARQYRLPILVVVFNNRGYQQMRKGHLNHYPEGIARDHALFHGVDIPDFNYEEFAPQFGFYSRRVERPNELPSAFKGALQAMNDGHSALLNVVTA
jgi:acetolactate synthase-1/2/3 large subunit